MTQIQFADKQVTYETFMNDFSTRTAAKLYDLMNHKENISQNYAYKRFGKAQVKKWVKNGQITPTVSGNQLQYKYSELTVLEDSQKLA